MSIVQRPYVQPQNPRPAGEKEEEKTSEQEQNHDASQRPARRRNVMNGRPVQPQAQTEMPSVRQVAVEQKTIQQQNVTQQPAPISKNDRPINAVSNKVNIAQILKDFRNTLSAIATPDILREEIEEYLQQVEEHTKGEAPSINFVQTNLLNAASIVDKYISEMLNKESEVVVKWLDALFLQRINYHFDNGEINEAFLVKFPGGENEGDKGANKGRDIPDEKPVETQYEPLVEYEEESAILYEPVEEAVFEPKPVFKAEQERNFEPVISQPKPFKKKPEVTIVPQDTELKSLFKLAQKHVDSKNPSQAMNIFNRALERAKQIHDAESESRICLEMGKIYDDNNYLVQALNSYNRSLKSTTDNNLKSEIHYCMANIYDDTNQMPSALKHYMASVSYAGENNNIDIQTKSLTKIGNIFSEKQDSNAFNYYNQALGLIQSTNDSKTKGFVFSNMATACVGFNRPKEAMRYYANAVKNYTDAGADFDIAENYKLAAELMIDIKKPDKAKTLLEKSLRHLDKTDDVKLSGEIFDLLEFIN